MSEAINPKQAEMVKVTCIKCQRVVRTVANWGVVGPNDLARLGWGVSVNGQALCDQCLPPTYEGVAYASCTPEAQCVDGELAARAEERPATKPDELKTIEAFMVLVERLYGKGHLKDAHLSGLIDLVSSVRHACIREEWGKD